MAVFTYSALKSDGSTDKGEVEASDRPDAFRRLNRKGLQPISLAAKGESKKGDKKSKKKGGKGDDELEDDDLSPKRLSRGQVILLTEEMSDLLGAGLQLEPALRIMESRDELSAVKTVTRILRREVRDGSSFSSALRVASPSFGDLYCNLASAGEQAGALPTILRRQAQYMVTLADLQSKVLFALIYPAFLVVSGIAVSVLFVTFLIPQLTDLLKTMGKELPLPAKIMQGTGAIVGSYWWLILIIIGLLVWLFNYATKLPKYEKKWHQMKLSMPLTGPVLSMRFYVQFLETLANLVGNGLPLLRALELTKDATVNLHSKEQLEAVVGFVGEGASLSRSLKRVDGFPPLLTDMITVGEQTGDLPLALERSASRYDKELQKKIEAVSALIQPVIIVIMAGIVGVMAYMMITVILESISSIK